MESKKSIMKENIGGLIFCIVFVLFSSIITVAQLDAGGGRYFALSLLHIPFGFIAWVIGNTIRKALLPKFVVTSGFLGLLKEKVFWRVGPQLILSIIVLLFASTITENSIKQRNLEAHANLLFDGGYVDGGSAYAEISREQFIGLYAGDIEFVETDDIARAVTLIQRGNKYIRVNGNVTYEDVRTLLQARPSDGSGGVFLDLSGVSGWAEKYYNADFYVSSLNTGVVEFLVLPDEFTEIPSYFLSGGNLVTIYIPHTVTKIGEEAFKMLRDFGSIVIPPSVVEMNGIQFDGCHNLFNIFFSRNSRLKSIGTIWHGRLTRLDFPPQLESIEALSVDTITELTFPETIKSIGRINIDKLHSVTILATNPPDVNARTFPSTIENIYVPARSLQVYEDAWFNYEFTFNNQLKPIR